MKSWDWDVDDINPDDNDGKLWVPVTAQTLNTGVAEEHRAFPPVGPEMPLKQIMMYVVQPNQDRSAEQASTLVLMPVQTPQ